MIPLRFIFRSRWAALIWSIGICWTAISFAGSDTNKLAVNAANSADTDAAKVGAALAEDD